MAITIDTFRILISEGQELLRDIDLYDRQFEFEGSGRYVLTGVRQAGKSYMLFKRARKLMSEGHLPEEFIYIDFDDERLIGMDAGDFDTILQAYRSTGGQKPILMFDEIQNIDGWEHFARRLANRKFQVYITGSNAKMLSRDIHTTLGGRYTEGTVYPYSFSEYLESQGIVPVPGWEYGSERFKVMEMLSRYLLWGGFPELMLFKNKRRWLNDLYEKILLNDIVVRGRIRNETALRMVFKRLAESIGKPIAYNRIANLIKSTGINTTPASVIQYVEAAKDAYIILSIENYATKFTERETVKKRQTVLLPQEYRSRFLHTGSRIRRTGLRHAQRPRYKGEGGQCTCPAGPGREPFEDGDRHPRRRRLHPPPRRQGHRNTSRLEMAAAGLSHVGKCTSLKEHKR